ncbi:MAG: chorismate mutase, partial [Haliscomenobacter sp.]
PERYGELVYSLKFRDITTDNPEFLQNIEHLRHEIDELDEELLNLLSRRMKLSEGIGRYKKRNNIAILQTSRWAEILDRGVQAGKKKGLSEEFTTSILRSIHDESINHQERIMLEEGE